ncbi:NAD(P)-dependent oxidoreductase [Streptomyces sp. NBC_00201]|uniref:NAD(P)-dependent oxidoreductase n=1 Tax=unclassified Streptomyces TaxID=2593676 RepID=UPI00224EFEB1|nr:MULTISPECIES: NAD(P)-dependent oxidoreductase [unclassified Streptomyces]MCX5250802.1 NAD(P)-dependent oxidoreductase [Streptomyces sp. NBC_00201]MCX5291269.1 NAD(P)-dependent oxidoreductase [Streptomyces sp. NBC_00183]
MAMSDREPRVAVIGTGRMGAAMAVRLRAAGCAVTTYNRTRAKAEATGAAVAGTPREAVATADVVLVSLADDTAVRQAYGGEDGIAAGLRPGTVVVETSTVAPDTVTALGPLVDKAGAALLDAPVSGSVSFVEQGRLTVMAGGDRSALEQARAVLDVLAAHVVHVGPGGTGAAMKLSVNSLLLGLNQALSEALVLAERAGVSRESAYEVFASGAAGAPFVQYKRDAYLHPEDATVAFTLELVAKDLDLVLALAERLGAPMQQAAVNRGVVADAVQQGFGERDLSALADFLRFRA